MALYPVSDRWFGGILLSLDRLPDVWSLAGYLAFAGYPGIQKQEPDLSLKVKKQYSDGRLKSAFLEFSESGVTLLIFFSKKKD